MSFANLTVGELRNILEQYPDDMMIILAEDGEGNSFAPLVDTTSGHYISETDYNGDFVSDEDIADDEDLNLDGATPAVVFWPAN